MTVLVSTHYMDEAERCDRIVYLANGAKVTEGRVRDIIDESGLATFRVEGDGVRELAAALEHVRGQGQEAVLEHIAYFGAALHVSGQDALAIEAALSRHSPPELEWRQVRPSLEDAFIALMARAGADQRQHG